jgi:MscS family membrane protein
MLERLVHWTHSHLFPGDADDSAARWTVFLAVLVAAVAVGRFGVKLVFSWLKRRAAAAGKNHPMVPALEAPTSTLVILSGFILSLAVLPLWESVPHLVRLGEQGAFTAVVLWGFACAGGAVIDHLSLGAHEKRLPIAAFLPLIKRSLAAFFTVLSVLAVLESLGFEVKTFLTGLGIGGLAFALAAQDTLANLFGSFVVVIDRPFYVGEYIRITGHEGTVEEIGLRSTRLRTPQLTQVVLPNKTVATEAITNFTRMPHRRVDTALPVAIDCPSEPLRLALADIRTLLRADPGVDQGQIVVSLADIAAASLQVQVLYFTADPDWENHMAVRERVNLGILRILAGRGVSLSSPTTVIRLDPTAGGPPTPGPAGA